METYDGLNVSLIINFML